MLAMQWARLNNVPFPDIDPTVVDREGLKECYIFENPNDPRCPIVMHFVLVNITFRDEKAPGRYEPVSSAQGYKLFSCSTQLNMKFQLLIKIKEN